MRRVAQVGGTAELLGAFAAQFSAIDREAGPASAQQRAKRWRVGGQRINHQKRKALLS